MSDRILNFFIEYGKIFLIILIGLLVIKVTVVITRKALKKSSLDPVLHTFILNAIKIILNIVLILTIIKLLTGEIVSLVAILSVAGAAIALALKDSLGNVAGGILLIATKPFTQGDFIDIAGTTGQVQHIDLLLTTLTTFDNKVITVPNGIITTSVVINYTREHTRRVDCVFGIGYDSNYTLAKELMLSIAKESPLIFDTPEPFVGVAANGDNSVDVDFRVWCKTEDYWTVKYYLEEKVKDSFDKEGINIPFPQMDVHIKER